MSSEVPWSDPDLPSTAGLCGQRVEASGPPASCLGKDSMMKKLQPAYEVSLSADRSIPPSSTALHPLLHWYRSFLGSTAPRIQWRAGRTVGAPHSALLDRFNGDGIAAALAETVESNVSMRRRSRGSRKYKAVIMGCCATFRHGGMAPHHLISMPLNREEAKITVTSLCSCSR